MVYSGKIYETDGAAPVAVHEAEVVRPLAPIPHAPSLRIFKTGLQPETLDGDDGPEPQFFYGNPMCLVGASQLIAYPDSVDALSFEPMVAAVVVADAYQVDLQDADDLILGLTLLNLLIAKDKDRAERALGAIGPSHDIGGAIGPVLTTPDELEDQVIDASLGRRYGLSTVVRVNGVERIRGNLSDLPFTFAEALRAASQSCTLRSGDIIALGPVASSDGAPVLLDPGDEVQLAVENLGAISLKLTLLQ